MRMEPEEIRKLAKRIAVVSVFFLVAVIMYFLGPGSGRPGWRPLGAVYGLLGGGSSVWRTLLVIYSLLITVVMVLAILVQSGSGGGLAGVFGGAGGESLLGARAATPIAKATYIMGGLLLFICMLLARRGY